MILGPHACVMGFVVFALFRQFASLEVEWSIQGKVFQTMETHRIGAPMRGMVTRRLSAN